MLKMRSRQPDRPSSSRSSKLQVWQNSNGEWCIGNRCFKLRAADDGVHVSFNPNSRGCPTNLRQAAEKLLEIAKAGKETQFHKIPEEW
jgi:hypothetical protein